MLRIGEFSKVAKTTIKTLRFYDKEGLFKPQWIDENGYRYYDIEELNTLLQIVEYRKLGLSIKEIKSLINGGNSEEILGTHLKSLILQKSTINDNILTLKKMLKEGVKMKEYKAIEKTIPDFNVYYRHGTIPTMENLFDFVLQAGEEARKYNPTLECEDYCFVTYTAKEYKEKDIELEYVEAVKGKVNESKNIKSKFLKGGRAICVEHLGGYDGLKNAYAYALNYVKEKGFEIIDDIREVYIHGCWDMDKEEDYLTEIQIPIK